jgi:hypothetical protein
MDSDNPRVQIRGGFQIAMLPVVSLKPDCTSAAVHQSLDHGVRRLQTFNTNENCLLSKPNVTATPKVKNDLISKFILRVSLPWVFIGTAEGSRQAR